MIPQRNISIIANKITTAGRNRIPETVIERDYVLAWFLSCMAGHRLRDSLEEVVVEKIEALSKRARNEPRDLYDLWYLLNHYDFWLPGMQSELEKKFEFRERSTEDIIQAMDNKKERLRRLWQQRLAQQVSDLPPYDRVFREVRRALRTGELNDDSERLPEPSN